MTRVILLDALKRMKKGGVLTLRMDCSKIKGAEKCVLGILKEELGITEKDMKRLMDNRCKEVRVVIGKKEGNCSNCSFLKTHNGCISGVNFKNMSFLATAMAV